MAQDKGKQKASIEEVSDVEAIHPASSTAPFLNRLANSASSLGASFSAAPSASSILAASGAEKGQGSTNDYPNHFNTRTAANHSGFIRPNMAVTRQCMAGNSFRNTAPDMKAGDPLTIDSMIPTEVAASSWAGEFSVPTPDQAQVTEPTVTGILEQPLVKGSVLESPASQSSAVFSDVHLVEQEDGAEVVTLLKKPGALFALDFLQIDIADSLDVDANDLFASDIMATRNSSYGHLRPAIADHDLAGRHGFIAPSSSANLLPDIAVRMPFDMVSPLPNSRTDEDEWLRAWSDVLEHYTDDVWGESIAAVRDARGLIEEVKTQATRDDADGKQRALRRLRAVLDHVKIAAHAR